VLYLSIINKWHSAELQNINKLAAFRTASFCNIAAEHNVAWVQKIWIFIYAECQWATEQPYCDYKWQKANNNWDCTRL